MSFPTNTLAGRIYLLQIFIYFFLCFSVECTKWKMIPVGCAGKTKCPNSDVPSKQRREQLVLSAPPHPGVTAGLCVKKEIHVWHLRMKRADAGTTLLTGP